VNLLFLTLLAAVNVLAAGYAHRQIPTYTAGVRRVLFTRLVLLGVGIAVGYVSASYMSDPLAALLAFLIGFGAVHLPAAMILFIKRGRGAAKS
jgi:cyanate permease